MTTFLRWSLPILVLCPWNSVVRAANHVRVILDTSQSMIQNDPPRLATLSTMLLYDLARPNLSLGDTFQVLTFESRGTAWTAAEPPVYAGPRISPERDNRTAFAAAIRGVRYDAAHTYYYPPLDKAISELESSGLPEDRRVIVLITDGKPEDRNAGLIRERLVPRLIRKNIQLYILAFGPEAASQSALIHETLGGAAAGALFVDQNGSHLPESMIEIFSQSFGYSASAPVAVTASNELNLEGGQSPERVAVVAYWRNPHPPVAQMRGPAGEGVNSPEGWRSTPERDSSYSVLWVLTPGRGAHRLLSEAIGATAIVVRPAQYVVEVQPQTPGGQTTASMARKEMPLRILVRPPGNSRGFQGGVQVSFQVHGPRQGNGFAWSDDVAGPRGSGSTVETGRVFDIAPSFPRDPEPSQESYEGYLTVEVRQGRALVGSLKGDHAHRVTVYPYVRMDPSPPEHHATVNGQARAIERRERGCATFYFSVQGTLPHSARPDYSVRAVLDPALGSDHRLDKAQFTLDGQALEIEHNSRPQHGDWYGGRRLNAASLTGPHEVCMQVGAPRDVDPGRPVELGLRFTLIETPYDGLPTIGPFVLKVRLAAPTWMERYGAGLAVGIGFLSVLLLWWYCRYREATPPNLRFAAALGEAPLSAATLGGGAPLRQWLGLSFERPALADNSSYVLGHIRPVNRDVYMFRSAPGIKVDSMDGTPIEYENGCARLSIWRGYLARSPRGVYRVRLEYA